MNPVVQAFIDQKNKEFEAAKSAEKQNFYNRNNLSTRVFEGTETTGKLSAKEKAEMYPFIDYSSGANRRYRILYPEFTDEEFEAMKKAQERVDTINSSSKILKENDANKKGSTLSTALVILALVVYVAAFIVGIEMGNKANLLNVYSSYSSNFDLGTAVIYWGIGLFSGTVMLGFASIVDHMNKQTALLRMLLRKK